MATVVRYEDEWVRISTSDNEVLIDSKKVDPAAVRVGAPANSGTPGKVSFDIVDLATGHRTELGYVAMEQDERYRQNDANGNTILDGNGNPVYLQHAGRFKLYAKGTGDADADYHRVLDCAFDDRVMTVNQDKAENAPRSSVVSQLGHYRIDVRDDGTVVGVNNVGGAETLLGMIR